MVNELPWKPSLSLQGSGADGTSGPKVARLAQIPQIFTRRPGAWRISQSGAARGAAASCRDAARGRVRQWRRKPSLLIDQELRPKKGPPEASKSEEARSGWWSWEERPRAPRPGPADTSDQRQDLREPER